ncbi:CBM96 family carbohydrate-binding protein [Arthrobacter globiformis]|uniref:CBM96 family carbohydrate-binding protein n=1 Tax=Arthrobacter globiformis TaxID=1665 RepID=UPI001FE13728|nr:DNRLRE domain-containing protein [Arthrobacter globiformis]
MTIPIQADVQLPESTSFRSGGRSRGRRASWLPALLAALSLALTVLVVPVTASAAVGDVGVEGPSHTGTGTPTGTKRQTNALWFNDGIWWGNLWDTASSDFHIFRFNAATSSWVNTGVTTETRSNTHHDVLWDGTTLYVASYRFVNDGLPAEPNFPSTMRRFSYNSSTKTYALLSSTNINNHKVETLSIDKDSTGRVWATWQQANRIYLNVTATDGRTWGTPFVHPASLGNVSVDDTSALIAFGTGKMGVMWSRQLGDANDGMYWSSHIDGAASTTWTTPVAAVKGLRSGDDHMNLKWLDSSTNRVFAAIKTSFTSASQPLIQLLAFDGTTWSAHTIATVAECPNRVIVMLDESTQRVRTFATYPKPSGTTNAGVCTSSGGAIYEKSTPLDNISFTTAKTARIVDADQYVHNATSTKQNLNSTALGTANSGLLVLADVNATSRYWHFYDPSGGAGGGGDTTETITLTATADSYVSSGATGTNFGTNTTLRSDNSPVEATYLKFDLSPYAGRTLVSARLLLRSGGNGSTGTQNVKLVASDSWTEGGITYTNRPALGTSIGSLGQTTTNTSYSVPLTASALTGDLGQQLSLGMDANGSDGLELNSKEAGSTAAPKLVLTLQK